MKYGKRIVRRAIDEFPYEKVEGIGREELRHDLLMSIKVISPSREGIFGFTCRWKIKIHYVLGYIKISYFPEYPSRKHRIFFKLENEEINICR